MATHTPQAKGDKLNSITDVSGAEPALREQVSRTGVDVEAATAALRDALSELHRSDDEAWRRYAADLEEATHRFDTTAGLAAARLRAERAASKDELKDALDHVAGSWRTVADEIRVQAHIGTMDVRDRAEQTVSDLERASQRIGSFLFALRDEVTGSLSTIQTDARAALDDAAGILRGGGHDDGT